MLKFIDWFAGIGGFRKGMELAGHKCVGFCEFDKYAVASYTSMHCITEEQRKKLSQYNLKKRQKEILKDEYRNGEWFSPDVTRTDSRDIPAADVWCFGFPCQDISVAGRQVGFEGNRSSLFFRITGLLRQIEDRRKPRFLFIENVKNLLSVNRGYDFGRLLIELADCGYTDVRWQLLNSKYFGVPQNRERVFIVASLGGECRREILPLCGNDEASGIEVLGHSGSGGQKGIIYSTEGITGALSATDYKQPHQILVDRGVEQIGQLGCSKRDNPNQYRVYDSEGVSPCLSAMEGGGREPHVRVGNSIKCVGQVSSSQDGQVFDPDGVSQCLSAGHGNTPKVIVDPITEVQCLNTKDASGKKTPQPERVYGVDGVMTSLCSGESGRHNVAIPVLTPDREEKRQNGRRFKENGEPMFTLTAQDRHGVMIEAEEPQVLRNVRSEYGKEIRKEYEKGNVDISRHEFLELEPRTDGVTNTLSTVTKDNLVLTKEVDGFNTMPDGSARTLKHQYQKNSAANFEKQNAMGATAVIEKSVDPTEVTMVSHEGEEGVPIKVANKKGYCMAEEGDSINFQQANSETRRGRVGKGIAQTLDTGCEQGVLVKQESDLKILNRGEECESKRVYDPSGIAPSVMSRDYKDAKKVAIPQEVDCININDENGKERPQQDRVYSEDGVMTALNAQLGGRHNVATSYRIRKLTPKECFRLQGWTDDYFEKAQFVNSDSQLYKQAGNGVTVNVIQAIAERFPKDVDNTH